MSKFNVAGNAPPDVAAERILECATAGAPIKQHNADELPSRKTLVERIEEQCDKVFQARAIVRVVGDLLHALNDETAGHDSTKLSISLSMSVAEEMLEKIAADLGGILKADA